MRAAQRCQKSYVHRKRRPLEFKVGDQVFLKVTPTKGITKLNMVGKLSPRYIGHYPVMQWWLIGWNYN